MSPICVFGKFHGLEPEVWVGARETDKVVRKSPAACQPITPLLLLLWLALGGGAWRGWCGTAWLSMGLKVVGFRFLPPFSASTRPAVLAFPPAAAAVFAPPVEEVALDVRVLPKAPP